MKFLMDQNTELVENLGRKPTNGIHEQAAEISLSMTNGQRTFMPDVSNLITSVSQLTSQNFELLKMATISGNDLGMGHESDLSAPSWYHVCWSYSMTL